MPHISPTVHVNKVTQTVLFTWNDIQGLLLEASEKETNFKSTSFEVKIEEQTEGSPPYRVGYKAIVHLTRQDKPV